MSTEHLAVNHLQRSLNTQYAIHGSVLHVSQKSGNAAILLANPNIKQQISLGAVTGGFALKMETGATANPFEVLDGADNLKAWVGSNGQINARAAAASTELLTLGVVDTPLAQLSIDSSGKVTWVGDTTLYRSAANTLKTDDALVVAGSFSLTGAASLGAAVTITGAATLSSSLAVTGVTSLANDLKVNTNKFVVTASSGNTAIAGTLAVTNAATLSSTLGVTGAVTLASTLGVTGVATFNNSLTVTATSTLNGNVAAGSELSVAGATTLASTLTVTGVTQLNGDLKVGANKVTMTAANGNITAAGQLTVTGATALSSTLSVADTLTLSKKLLLGSLATSAPTTIFEAYHDSTNATNRLQSKVASGNAPKLAYSAQVGATIADILVIDPATGNLTLKKQTNAVQFQVVDGTGTFTGNVNAVNGTLSGNLSVTGTTNLTGTLLINTNKFTVDASNGNTAVGGSLGVTGVTTLSSNAIVSGGVLSLNHATSNLLSFLNAGVAAPTKTTRSAGTKVLLHSALDASNTDYAIGIESQVLWQSVPSASQSFKWYAGTNAVATLSGTGDLTIQGSLYVNGTTTVVSSTQLNVADRVIQTNSGTGAANDPIPTAISGLAVYRGADATAVKRARAGIVWDEANARWAFGFVNGANDDALTATQHAVTMGSLQIGGSGFVDGNRNITAGYGSFVGNATNPALTVQRDSAASQILVKNADTTAANPAEITYDRSSINAAYKAAAGMRGDGNYFIWVNGSDRVQVDTSGNVNIVAGSLKLNGQVLSDNSRNLTAASLKIGANTFVDASRNVFLASGSGIFWPDNMGAGNGDLMGIKGSVKTGEATRLELYVANDADDDIYLNASGGTRVQNALTVTGSIYQDSNKQVLDTLTGAGFLTFTKTGGAVTTTLGTLATGNGGTGLTAFTANGLFYASSTSAMSQLTNGTNGQVLVGVTSGAPKFASMSGDATITNAGALTLATVNSNVGTYGSASKTTTFTVNGKGLVTAASQQDIAIAASQVTSGTFAATLLPAASQTTQGALSATDKTKLDGIAANANNYVHPSTDGNLHVPATGTANSGKFLKAGASAGSLAWATLATSDITNLDTTLSGKAALAGNSNQNFSAASLTATQLSAVQNYDGSSVTSAASYGLAQLQNTNATQATPSVGVGFFAKNAEGTVIPIGGVVSRLMSKSLGTEDSATYLTHKTAGTEVPMLSLYKNKVGIGTDPLDSNTAMLQVDGDISEGGTKLSDKYAHRGMQSVNVSGQIWNLTNFALNVGVSLLYLEHRYELVGGGANLNGITGGVAGQLLTIIFTSTIANSTIIINHNSGSTSAGSKILCNTNANVQLNTAAGQFASIQLVYDGTYWRLVSARN